MFFPLPQNPGQNPGRKLWPKPWPSTWPKPRQLLGIVGRYVWKSFPCKSPMIHVKNIEKTKKNKKNMQNIFFTFPSVFSFSAFECSCCLQDSTKSLRLTVPQVKKAPRVKKASFERIVEESYQDS